MTAHVYHGIHRRLLGQHTFEFLSRNDAFYRLLYGALNPVKFMCESLNISPAELQGLDFALAKTFETNAPKGFNLLGIHKDVAGKLEELTIIFIAREFLLLIAEINETWKKLENLFKSLTGVKSSN